jgi:hypothetical protein
VLKSCFLALVCATICVAQTPVRDSVKPDSARVTALPGMRSEALPLERQLFETQPNVSRLSVGGPELRAVPKFFSEADLLRTVQLLPGVEARNDFNAGLNVRGGEADQNLVLLDGYPIYNPFHLGGLFGTFIEPMVDRVDLFSGAYPASYGNRLSSVLDVRSAGEARTGLHGSANVSLIASQLSIGSTTASANTSWKVGVRRTYVDAVVKAIRPGTPLPYDFHDWQAFVATTLPGSVRASMTGYSGHDRFFATDSTFGREGFFWGNGVLGATLARTWENPARLSRADSVVVQQKLSMSNFDADILAGPLLTTHSPVRDRRANGSITFFGASHAVTAGWEVARVRLDYQSSLPIPIFPSDSQHQDVQSASLYSTDLWHATERLLIDAGMRADFIATGNRFRVNPVASAKYFVRPDLAVTAAVGSYSQWIRSLGREELPLRPLDFWTGSDASWPISTAWHYVLGAEGWLTPRTGFRSELFVKRYSRLLEPNPSSDPLDATDDLRSLTGFSSGFDLMLRRLKARRFTGWVSYTFEYNRRRDSTGHSFAPAQDRRHDLNAVGGWTFRKYTVGGRLNLATGTPYTYVTGSYDRKDYDGLSGGFVELDQSISATTPQYLLGPRNGDRYPSTVRLDLNVSRDAHIGSVAVAPYLSVVNATNAQNVFIYSFDYRQQPPTRTTVHQLSIVPTFGAAISW